MNFCCDIWEENFSPIQLLSDREIGKKVEEKGRGKGRFDVHGAFCNNDS